MTRRGLAGLCMAAGLALSTGTYAQQSATAAGSSDALTLTGCVDRAPNGTYHLLNARMDPLTRPDAKSTTGTTTGATGTSGATNAAGAEASHTPSTWILKSTTDLAPHVGHQVQVIGHLSAGRNSTEDAATTSNPTTTSTGARVKDPGETARSFDVQSVKTLSRACS